LPGQPPFKTQKQLAGRALVTDSFSSRTDYDQPRVFPGMAQYAHRDGYNVLYGDWSARWYGDPNQQIMWFDAAKVSSIGGAFGPFLVSLERNTIGAWTKPDGTGGVPYNSAVDVWHILDVAGGMDSGAP
jgi:hypothetical protein